jgi:Putative sensor
MGSVIPARRRPAWPRGRRPTPLRLLREPLSRRAWAELRYVAISLPVAVAGFLFTLVTTVLGVVTLGVGVGPPLLAASSLGARGLAGASRGLARRLLGIEVAPPPPFRPQPGVVGWIRSGITDAIGWRARAYLALKLLVAAFGYLVAGWFWVAGLSGLTYPLRSEILLHVHLRGAAQAARPIATLPVLQGNLVVVPVGLVLLLAAPWLIRVVVGLDLVLITRLIGPASPAARLRDLEQARAHAVDDSAARLRRIERDLHDGA